jgi:hypothetical protein
VHKKAKFRNLASDWENFRRIRNEIIDLIREAKKQYIIKLQNTIFQQRLAGENHRPAASHRQTLSLTVVWSTPRHEQD